MLHEALEDFDLALHRFDRAPAPKEQRRALREALAHLYAVHAHRQGTAGYWSAVNHPDDGGRVTQGVIYVRGRLLHHVTKEVGPRTEAEPSARRPSTSRASTAAP